MRCARRHRARERQRCQRRRRSRDNLAVGLSPRRGDRVVHRPLLSWGFLPGPELIKKNPEIIYSIVWIQGIPAILGTLVGFTLSTQLAKLAQVRYTIMMPTIFVFVLMGAFSVTRDAADLLSVVVFGIGGYFMRRFGYPRR